jgi:hypothetical protein
MHTYFLPNEQVEAYLRELVGRLQSMPSGPPAIWCPIGFSGKVLADKLLAVSSLSKLGNPTTVRADVRRNLDRVHHTVAFNSLQEASTLAGAKVLLLDSSVHSGTTMRLVYRAIEKLGPMHICSYALVLKQTSVFIPTFWGLLMDSHDRALFMMPEIANNRLISKGSPLHIFRLTPEDLNRPRLITGVELFDRRSWDEMYHGEAVNERTYLLEAEQVLRGFLTIKFERREHLLIREYGVDGQAVDRKRYLGCLLRFAETLARQADCEFICLYAEESLCEALEGIGYHYGGTGPSSFSNQMKFMQKRIV